MFTFYQTPEGFIIPKSMLDNPEIIAAVLGDDEVDGGEQRQPTAERQLEAKKARGEEPKPKPAEKKATGSDSQLNLFGDKSE